MSDAEASCRQAIRIKPDYAEAHGNLGSILKEVGRLEEAELSYLEAIRLKPDFADAHCNYGLLHVSLNRLDEAELSYREAIRCKPDHSIAHLNLGALIYESGRLMEAEGIYRALIQFSPLYAEAYSNLATVLRDMGCLAEALESSQKAIELRPELAEAHINFGITLRDLCRLKDAETAFRKAIELKPHLAEAHGALGNVLKDLGQSFDAESRYREAIRLNPSSAEAHNNLGLALADRGLLSEAESALRKAIELKADYVDARSNLLLTLAYGGNASCDLALREAKSYGAYVSSRAVPKFTVWSCESGSKRLRVGFVSGDLRSHSVGFFFEGVAKYLDSSRFELYAFPTTPIVDDLTDRIKSRFIEWVPLYGKSDLNAAKIIHSKGIHVLIDLSGHTAYNRLSAFAYKPAPVQVSWLGYCATTGLQEMDYVLGDAAATPVDEEWQFVESVWRLPESYICLTPPSDQAQVGELPFNRNGYFTFGSFNNLSKMTSAVVSAWAEILLRVQGSRLFLKTKQLSDMTTVKSTVEIFGQYGIGADRLILEGQNPSRAEHLGSYNRVDIALDTFPYNGVTTTLEALWMGVPVLTLKGDRFISNNGQSINAAAGQSDWICNGLDDYISKGSLFASQPQALAQLRTTLRDRVRETSLFDSKRFAMNFGDALWAMWETRKNLI